MGLDNLPTLALTIATFAALAYGIYRDARRSMARQEENEDAEAKELVALKLENLRLTMLLDAEKRDNERLRAERTVLRNAINVGGDMTISTIGNEAQVGQAATGKELGQDKPN